MNSSAGNILYLSKDQLCAWTLLDFTGVLEDIRLSKSVRCNWPQTDEKHWPLESASMESGWALLIG